MIEGRLTRRRLGWLKATVGVLAIGAAIALSVACGGSTKGAPTAASTVADGLRGAEISPPVPKPDVVLTDTSGKPFSLKKDTAGNLTLVFLGYTNCPDACPTTMNDFAQALKLLPADVTSHVKMVFVTTDPERDTPGAMRKWLDHFNPQFIGLTGTQEQLNALADKLMMPHAQKEDDGHGGYGVSHAAFTFAFTANDDTAHMVYPVGFTKEDLANDISRLVKYGWTS
jgi:protein SCO1